VPGVDRAITVSIGVADLIQHGGDAPGLLRQADRALYTAKARGRDGVVIAGVEERATEGGPSGDDAPTGNGERLTVGAVQGSLRAGERRSGRYGRPGPGESRT
jgi:Diguanylate cyclase, GGDEF domain